MDNSFRQPKKKKEMLTHDVALIACAGVGIAVCLAIVCRRRITARCKYSDEDSNELPYFEDL